MTATPKSKREWQIYDLGKRVGRDEVQSDLRALLGVMSGEETCNYVEEMIEANKPIE